jgi:hypothetical protein
MLGIVVHYESNKIATPPQRLKVNYVKDQGNNQMIKAPVCIGENSTFSNVQT